MFNIVAMIGPSGSGKTTIQKYLGIEPIVTYTSREARDGEVDGVQYHFTTREHILTMKEEGYLLEYTEYNSNLYASALQSIEEVIQKHKVASIVVDHYGGQALKENFGDQVLLMGILASKEECTRRISNRKDKNIEKRLASYEGEVAGMLEICDIVIINEKENWSKNIKILNWLKRGLVEGMQPKK